MLSAKKVLNTIASGLLSVLLAGTVWIGVPAESFAKSSSHKKKSADNIQIASLDSGVSGEEISADQSAESEKVKTKTKLAKKEKEAKSEKKDAEKKADAADGDKEKPA